MAAKRSDAVKTTRYRLVCWVLALLLLQTFRTLVVLEMKEQLKLAGMHDDAPSGIVMEESSNLTTRAAAAAAASQQVTSIHHHYYWSFNEAWNATPAQQQGFGHGNVPPVDQWLVGSPSLTNQTSVPRIIYKAFLSHGGTLPDFSNQSAQLHDAHESWLLRNPGYEMRYFDLISIRQYLQTYFHPVFLRAFDCIVAYAGKTDFFRVALLYREGGWYSDWKEICLEDGLLDSLSANNRTLVFGWDRGTPHSRQNACVMNAFLGATERNPMFEEYLRLTLQNVQTAHYGATPQSNTGPCVLGEAFKAVADLPSFRSSLRTFKYQWNLYYFPSKKTVIQHKCDGCGSWDQIGGNEYRDLHDKRLYYCPDSPSVLLS